MPRHDERRVLPHTPEQMFDLVADVARYPEFLPWCAALRIKSREMLPDGRELLVADMVASFKGFEERFTSRVTLNRAALQIDVAYVDGPFHHLDNRWHFEPAGEGATRVHFVIDFAFKSRLLASVAGLVFGRVVTRMTDAFEARARRLYAGG
ncbi:MAG: type II toxin-antitoxin system RatA family toxin [Alphaproteobacteria bacterium]|nr:type II toxin-antitoxin system RatA family toxin [Alphaproteobacteria bacterium]